MRDADTTAGLPSPPDPPQDRPGKPLPEGIAEVLAIIHVLLGYGLHLVETLERRAVVRGFANIAQFFGTARIPAIRARLARGLLRAMALERVLLARAARGRDLVPAQPRHVRAAAGATGACDPANPGAEQHRSRIPPVRPSDPDEVPDPAASANRGAVRGGNPPPPDRPGACRYLRRPRHLAQPV